MKLLIAFLLLLASPIFAADTLHIYTWADYINPDLVKRFEKEQKCKVVIDTFDSNESMYARLKAGATGYDLIFPSNYMVQMMAPQGMVTPLDHSKLPNIKNVSPEILAKVGDKKMSHSVPYSLCYGAIAYRKDKVKDMQPTWKMFTRSDLNKRVTLLDDMRETLGAALKSLGYSINTRDEKELTAARDVVIGWKKNIAKFDNEAFKAGIDSSEFIMVHGYSGDLWQVMQENDKVGMMLPVEGACGTCDQMVIPKNAPNPDLAHKMINFLLDGEVSAENMEWLGYLCPNTEGLKHVSKEFLANPGVTVPADVLAKCEIIQDVGEDITKYSKAWDEVKAAK